MTMKLHKKKKVQPSPESDADLGTNAAGKAKRNRLSDFKFKELFRFATRKEMVMLKYGLFLSAILGAAFPLTILVFRLVVNDFMNPDISSVSRNIYFTSIWFLVIACIAFLLAFAQTSFINYSSGKIAHRIRLEFLKSVFRQDMPWMDTRAVGDLISQLTEDVDSIQVGIGSKMTEFMQNMSSFFVGLLIAFFTGWKLTLVAFAMLPLILAGFMSFRSLTSYFTVRESAAYSSASRISEEVLRAIRTVFAFGGEHREWKRYVKHLEDAMRVGIKQSTCYGLAAGFIGFSVYCSAALVFWYGVSLLRQNECDAGSVVLVFLNVIIGSLFLGGALPNFRYFFAAKAAGQRIFSTIDRKPPIDKNHKGLQPEDFFESITFENVVFSYPSRLNNTILNDISLTIRRNQLVAFVGPSGCGKSTIMHLLQRFYDPVAGKITFDGINLTELDLPWYRSQIGIVQQEPAIFPGTILENIQLGNLDADREQIIEAAKQANAHQFISKLPDGYDTTLTQSGTMLSVGQKQRIAIARALVRNPRILILDEATSALDSHSEQLVQTALDQAVSKRTVLIVAHRLSTIQKADRIFVMEQGRICESGTHQELSQANGLYAALLKAQKLSLQTHPNAKQGTLDGDSGSVGEVVSEHDEDDPDVLTSLLPAVEKAAASQTSLNSKRSNKKQPAVRHRQSSGFLRVLQLNRPESAFILFGSFSAMLVGAIQPIFAVLYSELYAIFTMTNESEAMQSRINLLAWVMVLLGSLRLLCSVSQAYFFGVSGQRLTKRLRSLLFRAYLRQELSWFDSPEHQVGALTVQLATEANKVHPFCGSAMGLIVESVVLVIFSLTVGFCYNWKLTLVVVVFFPVIVLSSFFNMRLIRSQSGDKSTTDAIHVAHSALSTLKTVTSFGLEDHFCKQYNSCLESEMRQEKRRALCFGFVYGLSQSLPICSYAAAFSFGAYLIGRGEIELIAIFRVFAAISFAAQALGRTSHLGPEMRRASRAASHIFSILDRQPLIPTEQGVLPDCDLNTVPIEFRNVTFAYPSRPSAPVLQNFSYRIEPAETVAIVGHSGCGKTSLFKLLLRYYDLQCSRETHCGVFVGTQPLDRIAPTWLRKQIGIVEQEPHLFNLTIRENIAYGDNSRVVDMEEIIGAARLAQIHDFIMTLQLGYDTPVGAQGCELSVGQKQRLAIARMIVHRPKLIILDEATSALDSQTEMELQNTLAAQVSPGKTVLLSAHRLSALKHAQKVAVLVDGALVESGSPGELMQLNGSYYGLFHSQLSQ